MILGVTATRAGLTNAQRAAFRALVERGVDEFHHGDCIGGDDDAHAIVRGRAPEAWIVAHPCTLEGQRAWTNAEEIRESKAPLVRNRDIVDEVEELVAMPGEMEEQVRSGTWATVRYARRIGRTLTIIYPDGTVVSHG